jgi:hypothetical protein
MVSRFLRVSRPFSAAVVAVVAAGSVLATPGTAQATTVDQTCVGTWAVTYDPPITNTTQTVHATLTGFFPTCTDVVAFNASYVQVFTDTVSCATLLTAGAATRTFIWGNPLAAPTTFAYNWTVTDIAGQVVVTNAGMITNGRYTPDSAVQVATLVTPNAVDCAGPGIPSLTGPTTLTIYHP